MTNIHHIEDRIDDYFDDTLSSDDRVAFEAHLDSCSDCRALVQSYTVLFDGVKNIPESVEPQADLWHSIEDRLDTKPAVAPRNTNLRLVAGALAAAAVVAFVVFLYSVSLPDEGWEIVPVAGNPTIDESLLDKPGLIRSGQTIRTDNTSRAVVEVGEIGALDVFPSTHIELLSTSKDDHRFRLSGGEIHATINAPPRIFFVETPSALAIDLGCEYTLRVDSSGVSRLHVTFGYVELDHPERSTIVPEGYKAVSDPDRGPTVPIYEDASPDFVDALISYEIGNDQSSLDVLLVEADPTDATSLWLLISRASAEQRVAIYQKIVELVGEPEGVTMSGVLEDGDRDMSLAWQDFLGLDLTLMSFDGVKPAKK